MSLCPDCLSGVILPGTPRGVLTSLNNTTVYLATPPSPIPAAPGEGKKAIVLFTDWFGLGLKNCKILADYYAREVGLEVWVPDMFDGHPPVKNEQMMPYDAPSPGQGLSWWKWLGFALLGLRIFPGLMMGRNSEGRINERMRRFVESLKREKGISQVGAIGYCMGGSVVIALAPYHLLSSGVVCHPGSASEKVIDQIDFPLLWVSCEEDFLLPPSRTSALQSRLLSRNRPLSDQPGQTQLEFEFKQYNGTRHGFACRPDLGVEVVRKAYEEAREQGVGWFRKTMA